MKTPSGISITISCRRCLLLRRIGWTPCRGAQGFEEFATEVHQGEKPSVPIGETGKDAFGDKPIFLDKGLMDRAIVNIGREDVDVDGIRPTAPRLAIVGASSDHLILDVTAAEGTIRVGADISFSLNYSALLAAMTSPYVAKSSGKKET